MPPPAGAGAAPILPSWSPDMTNPSVPLAGHPLDPAFPPRRASGAPPGAASPENFVLGPLHRRLFFIVLVGLLPLALLACATLLYNASEQRKEILRATDDAAVAILAAVDTELALALASLNALAISPRLANDDWPAFHAEARRMLEQRPGWANVVLSTPGAEQLVNARLPYGARLPSRVAPDAVAATAHTGHSRVGNLVFGPALQEYAFAVHTPVLRDGIVSHVLSAPIRPAVMADVLRRQAIAEPTVAVILDGAQKIVARSRRPQDTVGKPASSELVELLRTGRSGTGSITRTLEGGSVYTIFRRSDTTGWSVAIGIPTSALDAPVVRSYVAMGASLALSVVLGLLAALVAARSIVRPMRELEAAAHALAHGRAPVEPRTSLTEVRQVGRALVQAQVERERLLESERDARRVAENASRAKDEFLAMLGHELRNPLAAISTAAQILERVDDDHGAMAADARAIIGRQARNLARMTDDLLDAGRVMLGKIELKCAPVDLAALVGSVADTLHSTGRLVDRRATHHPRAGVGARRRDTARAGGEQPAQQRDQVHLARRRDRRRRPPRGGPGDARGERRRHRHFGRPPPHASSTCSCRGRSPWSAAPAGSASGSRWRAGSSSCTADASPDAAKGPSAGAGSRCSCRPSKHPPPRPRPALAFTRRAGS